jgi:nitroreductase
MSVDCTALLEAAVLAPSGDNTQPWRFDVDPEDGWIACSVVAGRDPSPMNAGQRMARIALGAAIENLLLAAEACGLEAQLEQVDDDGRAWVRVHPGQQPPRPDQLAPVRRRVTNRRLYDRQPVPHDVLATLRQRTPPLGAVRTHWLVERERVIALAELIGRADATMFGQPAMRQAFLSKVRFDLPADATAEEGLPLGSLELSRMDHLALRMMPRLPNWLLKYSGGLSAFARKARQLVESASGLCVVVAPDGTAATDLAVGQAMQRAWLALTEAGLAAQPMMSLPVLENVLENGDPAILDSIGRERIVALSTAFRSLVPEVGSGRPAWLMRFGYAPAPSGRTGRLPIATVVHELSAAR